MKSPEIEEWEEQVERLATARDRGDFEKARRVAMTLDALACTDFFRNLVAYLRATIEIVRLLDTPNHDLLRRHLARARIHLEALAGEELAVRCALAEVNYHELLVSLSVISFPSEERARVLLQARLDKWMKLRDELADEELAHEGRLRDEPRWKLAVFAGFSLPAFAQHLGVLFRRKPEVALEPGELREIVQRQMMAALERNHGNLDGLMRSVFRSPGAIEDFCRWREESAELWLKRPGASELKGLLDDAVRAGLTAHQYREIRERAMEAICDAMFRGAELVVDWQILQPSRPEARARLLAKTLGFVAETVYKPLLVSFVEVARAVSGYSDRVTDTLGSIARPTAPDWRGRGGLRSAIVDEELIAIRNAVQGHPCEEIRDRAILFPPQRERPGQAVLEMSFERLDAKAHEVGELIVTMLHAWVYVEPPREPIG